MLKFTRPNGKSVILRVLTRRKKKRAAMSAARSKTKSDMNV